MSEISVTVNGSTTINPTVGNGDVVNVTISPTGERGPTGATGASGPANSLTIGTVTSGSAAATITGTAPSQTLNLVLPQGDAGVAVELQANGTHIQWRYVGGSSWTNLVALSAITGPTGSTGANGTAVELQATSTHLQWRYVGGSSWTNVYDLSQLVGPQGPQGATGPQGPAGSVNLADETPQPLGTASAGSATTAARADHVHAVPTIAYSSLTGVPSTFAPSSHTQAISTITGLQAALDGLQPAGTYATLVGGTVPSSQLPSYVDDVREAANLAAFPATGDAGVIYVAIDTKKIYRWSGSAYVEISASPGSTDSVTEGSTNLYFTNARAIAAIPTASASVAGVVKVGDGLSITSGVLAATGTSFTGTVDGGEWGTASVVALTFTSNTVTVDISDTRAWPAEEAEMFFQRLVSGVWTNWTFIDTTGSPRTDVSIWAALDPASIGWLTQTYPLAMFDTAYVTTDPGSLFREPSAGVAGFERRSPGDTVRFKLVVGASTYYSASFTNVAS